MFVIIMSNLVELFGCVRLLLGEKEEEMTVRPLSRCLLSQTVVILCVTVAETDGRSCNCDVC